MKLIANTNCTISVDNNPTLIISITSIPSTTVFVESSPIYVGQISGTFSGVDSVGNIVPTTPFSILATSIKTNNTLLKIMRQDDQVIVPTVVTPPSGPPTIIINYTIKILSAGQTTVWSD